MTDNYFDVDVAEDYDQDSAEAFAPATVDAAVAVLAELAGDGPALELAVGTGRIALPLHRRGVPVHGIELSEAMVAVLRRKEGAQSIGVTVGDMTTATAPGSYALAYLVFNTIGNVTTQDGQVACFRNAAAHLQPGGHFVIEVGVPDLQRLPAGERFYPFTVRPDHAGIDEYDVSTQRMWSHHYAVGADGVRARSIPFRYVWPSELDLMARLAGMRLVHRWSGWDRAPFTNDSRSHVSVWRRPVA